MSFEMFICGAGGAALITGAVGIIRWLMERHAKKKDTTEATHEERMTKLESNMDALIAGVRSLLYSEIKDRGKQAIIEGYISPDELEDITRKHELYHGALKGNGYLDALMDKVKALPVHD